MSDEATSGPGAAATSERRGSDSPEKSFVDSIAVKEFASAVTRLQRRPLDDRRRALPLQFGLPMRRDDRGAEGSSDDLPAAVDGATGPIGAALAALGTGDTSVEDMVTAALGAIEGRDPELNAVVALLAEEALQGAQRLDTELSDGSRRRPLHGIPITVKDVIDVAGAPTRAGSTAYFDAPTHDADAVARLRSAGAIVIAKTATHEFALGVTNPQSRNPHDVSRIPGGSSGGSAIAVATGMGLGSLGTDTRASIRVPAALSGVVGFKPTLGKVSTRGVVTLSWTMDHVAPMATTVGDAARLVDVLFGHGWDLTRIAAASAEVDLSPSTLAGVRIGVPEAGFAGAQPDVEHQVRAAIAQLATLGALIVDGRHPSATDFDDANAVGLIISRAEAATFHRGLGTDLSRCWTEVAEQLDAAMSISAVDYLAAQRFRGELTDRMLAMFDEIDVMALPTALVTAPPVDDFAAYLMVLSRNAIPWSLVGFPAVSIPCGLDRNGLPVGLQLVAPPDREDRLVRFGCAYESVRDR